MDLPKMTRRDFNKSTTLGVVSLALLAGPAARNVRGANDRLGIGLIGSGNQGRFDLSSMLRTGQVSLAVADLKGDGQPVLVTGKRFYAHEHDPGANEPLGVYWYEKIQAEGRLQWRRHVIDYGGRTGEAYKFGG